MKKKIILFVAILLLFAAVPTFAQAGGKFLAVGMSGFNSWYALQQGYYDAMSWGVHARLKTSKILGFTFDMVYQGTMYYYEDYWYGWQGPMYWDQLPYDVGEGGWYYQDEYPWNHTEWVIMADIALFLPMAFVQPYIAVGPAFYIYVPGEGYDYYDGFDYYYDSQEWIQNSSIGYNIKVGCDLFISKSISIGVEVDMIVDNIPYFLSQIQSLPTTELINYLYNNSFVGFTALFWL